MTKPTESPNPWETLNSEEIYRNPWFGLRKDRVRTHTGAELTYTFMEHPGAVAVVPVTKEGQIVLMRQYRYTVKDWCWEVPMGGRDKDSSEAVALNELKEEVGGTCDEIRFVAEFYANNGVSDIKCEVYLATGVVLGESEPEDAELIETSIFPKDVVIQMARSGDINDGMSALSILLCEQYLS